MVQSPYVVSSPFPAEAFDLATSEGSPLNSVLRTRGCDPHPVRGIHGCVSARARPRRLRYGLATRDAQRQLEVWDPADAADAAGDAAARMAWNEGIGALPRWVDETNDKGGGIKRLARKEKEKTSEEGRSSKCRYIDLLDVKAVEMIIAAAAELSLRKKEIWNKVIMSDEPTRQCRVAGAPWPWR